MHQSVLTVEPSLYSEVPASHLIASAEPPWQPQWKFQLRLLAFIKSLGHLPSIKVSASAFSRVVGLGQMSGDWCQGGGINGDGWPEAIAQ